MESAVTSLESARPADGPPTKMDSNQSSNDSDEEKKRALKEKRSYISEEWKNHYKELKQFKDRFGHSNVPGKFKENRKLGKWVQKQRYRYKNLAVSERTGIDEEKIQMLEEVGFAWCLKHQNMDIAWKKRYESLKQFKAYFGHCDVPQNFSGNPQLGYWVIQQRIQYNNMKAGKESGMTEERIQALEEIEFSWESTIQKSNNDFWNQCYEELKQIARSTRCTVSQKLSANQKHGACTKQLDDDAWNERYEELKEFKVRFGHCDVHSNPGNPDLGIWVSQQRTQYTYWKEGKPSSMTEEKVKALNQIDFVWSDERELTENDEELKRSEPVATSLEPTQPADIGLSTNADSKLIDQPLESEDDDRPPKKTKSYISEEWKNHYKELKQFKERFGHCKVPSKFHENLTLARWVKRQRTHYKDLKDGKPTRINEEKIKMLEEIGFAWCLQQRKNDAWKKHYEEIKQFKAFFGHCDVPQKFSGNPQLGNWVIQQRKQYKSMKAGKPSNMTVKKVQALEDLEFSWESTSGRNLWNERYEELRQFKARFGHNNAQQNYPQVIP